MGLKSKNQYIYTCDGCGFYAAYNEGEVVVDWVAFITSPWLTAGYSPFGHSSEEKVLCPECSSGIEKWLANRKGEK